MRYSLVPILVAGLIKLSLAKGGGSGGGGGRGGGSSSKDSFVCKTTCKSNISFMYGQAYTSMYTSVESIAQASLYAFWLLVIVGFWFRIGNPRAVPAVSIRGAILLFSISLVLLFVRYALLATETLVPTWYRSESSVAIAFWRLGFTFLLVATSLQVHLEHLTKYANVFLQFLLGLLNLVYVILDFKLSDRAVDSFHVVKDWRLSDRDFGLTLSLDGITALVTSNGNSKALTSQYIQSKMMDVIFKSFQKDRTAHLRIGLVTDLLSLLIASLLLIWAVLRLTNREWKPFSVEFPYLFFAATSGLFLSTIFRFVITTHFVLHNWSVVTNIVKWNVWMKTYKPLDLVKDVFPATTFLKGYRVTATGFPIMQTVIESFGIVVAIAAIACADRIQGKAATIAMVRKDETVEEIASTEETASLKNKTTVKSKVSTDEEVSEKAVPIEKVVPVENKVSEEKVKV